LKYRENANLGWVHAILGVERHQVAMMTMGEGGFGRDILFIRARF